jgi:hypothetical protein
MAAPVDFVAVLLNVSFNAMTRGILVDADRENLNLASLFTWTNENVVRTLRKIPPTAVGVLPYVPVPAIDWMKTLTYICHHMVHTQRVPTIGFFTSARINLWTQERKSKANYKEPDDAPKLSKSDNATILEFIDDFPEQLARFTGLGGRPLAYVIRELEPVLPEADDPIFGEPNSQYISVRDEVTSRAALTGTAFQADNKWGFQILRDAISEFKAVKVWLKGHTRSKDGYAAWKIFTTHYLGSAQLDTIANHADVKIEMLAYIGEKQRYSFETHVSNFKQAHLDLQKAGNEPDGCTKVCKFLQSIKAPEMQTDPSSGRPILLILHQAIYIRGMKHNLLCPMHLWHNSITVNERPKHCSPSPNREDHSIIVPDIDYLILLSLHGVTSYFPTQTPSKQEAAMYKVEGEYLELTAETPSWDPNSLMFSQLESRLVDQYGELVD